MFLARATYHTGDLNVHDGAFGDDGDDLLVAGFTSFDSQPAALGNIKAEWSSASDYPTRLAHLTGTAGGLNGTTFLGEVRFRAGQPCSTMPGRSTR